MTVALTLESEGLHRSTYVSKPQSVEPSAKYQCVESEVAPTVSWPSTRLLQYIARSQTTGRSACTWMEKLAPGATSAALMVVRLSGGRSQSL